MFPHAYVRTCVWIDRHTHTCMYMLLGVARIVKGVGAWIEHVKKSHIVGYLK